MLHRRLHRTVEKRKRDTVSMDPEENTVDTIPPAQEARGCYQANFILNAFVALGLGIATILILNIFNRSGGFALLSGLFAALLYSAVVFPRLLSGRLPGAIRRNYGARNNAIRQEEQGNRPTAKSMAFGGLAISSILAIAAGIGLYYIPANGSIFAFVDAVLALVICVAFFIIGLSLLAFFFGRGHAGENGAYFDL